VLAFLALAPSVAEGRCLDRAGWALSTTEFSNDYTRQAFVGNGYLSQRVPAAGAGYRPGRQTMGWPIFDKQFTGAFVSGLYRAEKDVAAGRQALAAVPTWSTLSVRAGGDTYSPATPARRISRFRQSSSSTATTAPRSSRPTASCSSIRSSGR
jgi:trehalose/maltose hydrolase-like predicted phosphorylase